MNQIKISAAAAAAAAAAAIALAMPACATGMAATDSWIGQDKAKHLIAGASIGLTVGALADSWVAGAAAGCVVGALKEVSDMRSPAHTPSYKDAAVTCIGAAAGAKLGIILAPVPGGVFVGKSWSF